MSNNLKSCYKMVRNVSAIFYKNIKKNMATLEKKKPSKTSLPNQIGLKLTSNVY